MDVIIQDKKALRKDIISKRDALGESARIQAETDMLESITGLEEYGNCENILLYASYGSELRTDELIIRALADGKRVFLPLVCGKDMRFYRIGSLECLCDSGYKGIREPKGDTEVFEYPNSAVNLLIMPGVAFDKEGYRLGYGGGFYDRYLADKEELRLYGIAIGFKMQEVSQLPRDEFDLRPGKIMLF